MYKKLLFSFFIFSTVTLFAQENWNKTRQETTDDVVFVKSHIPSQFELYTIDIEQLKDQLQYVEMNGEVSVQNSTTILNFPDENGKMEAFKMLERSIFEPDLAEKFPMIKTYIGQSVNKPNTILTMSIGTDGLHVMVTRAGKSALFVDPYTRNRNKYILYTKNNLPYVTGEFVCDFKNDDSLIDTPEITTQEVQRPQDGKLRLYRLAVACTIEYSQFHLTNQGVSSGASLAVKKAAVLSAITNTINRVEGVYRLELGVTFNLIGNEDSIIFINSDSFSNNNAGQLINESHNIITSVIGTANFDVGHTFSTGGGGLAQRGSICYSNAKGRGITGSPQPIGDTYDIDYVAHEMGHQFGANHTFNAQTGSCGGGNRNDATAGEPGSGSTIMAYAGICSPNNVQSNSDAYFNYFSINEINSRITSSPQCAVITNTGNVEPTANAGADNFIPKGTAFILEGVSNDTSTPLYCWEQIDTQGTNYPLVSTATSGPAYRSFLPTVNPKRYMPKFSTVLGGSLQSTWEVTPTIGRTLHFALTTRDYDPNGGQTNVDTKSVFVINGAGPFIVTSQTASETWNTGETKTINWNVAGTTANGINTSMVKIAIVGADGTELSVLTASTPNDGSETITVPNIVDGNTRIMVSAVGNIFYAVNSATLAINAQTSCTDLCASSGSTQYPDGTTLVQFNSINNPSTGASDYSDYTAISTNVTRGQNYDLTVHVNSDGNYKEVTKVWIDWNRDCTFNTTDEEYTLGEAVNVSDGATSLSPLNIVVPAGASLGSTTMRVTSKYTGNPVAYPTSCQTSFFGEVEDYTIVIVDNNASLNNINNFNNFVLSPNPNNGNFNISLQTNNNKVQISVYDVIGRQVYTRKFNNNQLDFNQNINLNNVEAGMYIVHVSDGTKTTSEKIIIE